MTPDELLHYRVAIQTVWIALALMIACALCAVFYLAGRADERREWNMRLSDPTD